MSLILNGTDGLSDVDGTAGTPAIRGTDANTGIFFPAADTIAFAEGGAEVARFDSSGNLGIGTTSPASRLQIGDATVSTSNGIIFGKYQAASQSNLPAIRQGSFDGAAQDLILGASSGTGTVRVFTGAANSSLDFGTASSAERMRIDSSGNVIVSGTSTSSDEATYQSGGVFVSRRASSAGTTHATFLNGGNQVGSITSNTTTTFFNTTSDYRLKENATPITNGLQTIALLKPVNFDWISNRISDTGFLAHEFQAVIPNSVMGTKDAVDENGKPIHQQIDRGGSIPFLVAAIQELKATVDAQAVRIAELEGAK